jgi:hypothetical protein
MLEPQTSIGDLQVKNIPVGGGVSDVTGTAAGITSFAVRGMLGSMWRRRGSSGPSAVTKELAKC